MKKRKIKKNIPYRDVVIYTSKFLTYNKEGNILSVDQEKDVNKTQLEINLDLIPNFLLGAKKFTNYSIEYFIKLKEGIIKDTDSYENFEKYDNVLFKIQDDYNENASILIEHNSMSKCWNFTLNTLEKNSLQDTYYFFICKKNNPSFLYSSYIVNFDNTNNVSFNFNTDLELSFNHITVFTLRKFKLYSLRNSNVE